MSEEKDSTIVDSGSAEQKKVLADYPSNSKMRREEKYEDEKEPKKVKKVIQGSVVKKKKSFLRRFTETFLGDDVESVFSYIMDDVLIPAAKGTLSDMVSGGIEMLLFGERRNSRSRRNRGGGYVSYDRYYDDRRDNRRDRREPSSRNRTRHNFDDIILETRGEAEEVLNTLVDLIDDYEVASVADLYEMVGITGSHTDNKYGWTNLSDAKVYRVRDGYLVDLPRAKPID